MGKYYLRYLMFKLFLRKITFFSLDSPESSWNGGAVGQTVAGVFSASSRGLVRIFSHFAMRLALVLAVSGCTPLLITAAMANLSL
jgi:hypothetical protein